MAIQTTLDSGIGLASRKGWVLVVVLLAQGCSGHVCTARSTARERNTSSVTGTAGKPNERHPKSEAKMTPEIEQAAKEFRDTPEDRVAVAKALLPALEVGMPRADIEALLARPTMTMWDFGLFYSSNMAVWFDKEGKLATIESDLMGEVRLGEAPAPLDSQSLRSAAADFRANPFNRRRAAKSIIAAIGQGIDTQVLAPILGRPTRTLWRYHLAEPSTLALDVTFDEADKVASAEMR
jgi:hypothetical protein